MLEGQGRVAPPYAAQIYEIQIVHLGSLPRSALLQVANTDVASHSTPKFVAPSPVVAPSPSPVAQVHQAQQESGPAALTKLQQLLSKEFALGRSAPSMLPGSDRSLPATNQLGRGGPLKQCYFRRCRVIPSNLCCMQ